MKEFLTLVEAELQRALSLHGDMNSLHEGLAVIWEEFEEVKNEIFKKSPDKEELSKELVQVASMCAKLWLFVKRK